MTTVPTVTVISGVPGAGKTTFAKHLESMGWCRVEHDRATVSSGVDRAWLELLTRDNLDGLTSAAQGRRVVVEFGYPVDWLPRVEQLMARGVDCWWFHADYEAARKAWRRAWHVTTDAGEAAFRIQVAGIQRRWREIAAAYGDRVIDVLAPDGRRLSHDDLMARMGLGTAP